MRLSIRLMRLRLLFDRSGTWHEIGEVWTESAVSRVVSSAAKRLDGYDDHPSQAAACKPPRVLAVKRHHLTYSTSM